MSTATACRDGHEAYLQALDRALRVGILASLVVHAVLAGLLPSPFHHEHPLPPTLEVALVEVPPAPPAPSAAEPQLEPPAASLPVAPPAAAKPAPPRRAKSPQPPRRVRAPVAVAALPPTSEAEHVLTHAEPEKAVAAVPAPPAGAEMRDERPAAAQAKAESSDAGPVAPPSFRAGYLDNPEPVYPTASRRLGEEGTVQLRVLVSTAGQPVRVDVHRSSSHPRLDEAAAAAVRQWRFVPAKRGATPVEATVIVPIVFRLEAE